MLGNDAVSEAFQLKIWSMYIGQWQVSLRHEGSGVSISTDAPKSGGEQSFSFTPIELLAAALGSCVWTAIGAGTEHLMDQLDPGRSEKRNASGAAPIRISHRR